MTDEELAEESPHEPQLGVRQMAEGVLYHIGVAMAPFLVILFGIVVVLWAFGVTG